MPPLTEEFIKALKADLRNNPIDRQSTYKGTNAKKNQWRIWQNIFDRRCAEWNTLYELTTGFSTMIQRCNEFFSDFPVVLKGAPFQQMGIFGLLWHSNPNLLIDYYGHLKQSTDGCGDVNRDEGHEDFITMNLEQIIATMLYSEKPKLSKDYESRYKETLKAARRKSSPVYSKRRDYLPKFLTPDTLESRIADFIFRFVATHDEDDMTVMYVMDSDLDGFFNEMWIQDPATTIDYAEALQRSMNGRALRNLPLTPDERERLCLCAQRLDQFLHAIDLAKLSSADQIMVEGYRTDHPLNVVGTPETADTSAESMTGNIIRGPNATLRWKPDFSIVWRDKEEICIQKTMKSPMIQRAIIKMIEWYRPDNPDVDLEELCEAIGCSDPKFDKLFGTYTHARNLIIRVPGSRWKVRLNI